MYKNSGNFNLQNTSSLKISQMWLASLLFVLEAYLSVLTVYDVSESGLTFSRGVLSQL